jgi:hypothetical protein
MILPFNALSLLAYTDESGKALIFTRNPKQELISQQYQHAFQHGRDLVAILPTKPKLTEENLPRQDGKAFIVTERASGVGYEICTILY